MTQSNSSTDAAATLSQPRSSNPEVTITRILDAPRELVWRVWTDPKQMAQWWGPKYFTNPVCELDVRPGGAILIHMAGPDGSIFPMKGIFSEVIEPERLVFSASAFASEKGEFMLEDITTVTFAEHDGKTQLTVHCAITRAASEAASAVEGMEEGWNQSLDKLVEFLQ